MISVFKSHEEQPAVRTRPKVWSVFIYGGILLFIILVIIGGSVLLQ